MYSERLKKSLLDDCGLRMDGLVVVGVSGGADSLALAHMMSQYGFRVLAAHLDHGIRPEAGADAAYVRSFADAHHLDHCQRRFDVPGLARRLQTSLEDAARRVRYQFLFEIAEKDGAQAVAVGHTADDQVETILLHILQGCGLEGLSGMRHRLQPNPWHASIPLVRPLLGVWRQEVEAYCQEHALKPLVDRTNRDPVYLRNRIRMDLIPMMQSLQPAVKQNLLRLAQSASVDSAFLTSQLDDAWLSAAVENGPGWLSIDRRALSSLHPALRSRVIRRAFQRLAPANRDLDMQAVNTVLGLVKLKSKSAKRGLPGRLRAWLEGDFVYLAAPDASRLPDPYPQARFPAPVPLPDEGGFELNQNWTLFIETNLAGVDSATATDPWHAWLDQRALKFPLEVRNPDPGDRFQPLGMDHPMRLSDFWINQSIPLRLRSDFPLVMSERQIVWVPGLRIAEWAKASPGSTQFVHLWLQRSWSH